MTATFDLLHQPWIPVIDCRGQPLELSLLEVLDRAHELAAVEEASPLVTVGLHRFLFAVLHHYLPLADEDDWEAVWSAGRLPKGLRDKVANECAGRLDLFHKKHPFFQSGDIPLTGKPGGTIKTVGYLFPEASTGTNIVHFSHPGEDSHAYCPACCARGLVAQPPFAMAGGRGMRPGINGVPPFYVVPHGSNLAATLLLNYVLPTHRPRVAADTDPGPVWCGDGEVPEEEKCAGAGFVESLTFPSRRMRLFPDCAGGICSRCGRQSGVLVRRMVYDQGCYLAEGRVWRDPWVSYALRRGANNAQSQPIPIRPSEERSVWRDFPRMFLKGQTDAERCAILNQLDDLIDQNVLDAKTPVAFEVTGVRTDMKAKVFEWIHSSLDFPLALIREAKAAPYISGALKTAEDVAGVIADALCRLHPDAERQSPKWADVRKAMRTLITRTQRQYWQELEIPFRRSLQDPRLTGSTTELGQWQKEWRETVFSTARRLFEQTVEAYDSTADELRRQQTARHLFYGVLKKMREKGETSDEQPTHHH